MSQVALLSIDQGTTSSRAILFSCDGEILSVQQKELRLHYPEKGWVEQDANDIWDDTLLTCRAVINDAERGGYTIGGIGITNQRETTMIWNRDTGVPIHHAIVWQDRRTAAQCAALKHAGHEPMITQKTGLLLDPYFSATKIAWILDHVKGARDLAQAGKLAFGTVDCYLLWKLTGGKVHATDATNASRTMLFNIVTQQWDEDLLKLFDIPRAILPDVRDCVADFGQTEKDLLGRSYTVGGIAGDQQAALIGQACFKPGMMKSTYGTGCFALVNIGPDFIASKNRLLTTPAYRLNGQTTYAIEGSIFVAGAAIQWLRDGLGLFEKAPESEALALSVNDSNGVYFVPAFTGLGAPYWAPEARAMIAGMSRETTAAHIVRAALEAQAYQTLDLIGAMQADSGFDLALVRADGGLVSNGFMCQFLADMLNTDVEIPHVHETTAWGAACLAGLQSGVLNGLDDVTKRWRRGHLFQPRIDENARNRLYQGWGRAIQQVLFGSEQA
jgi:glycerol kinase